MDQVKIKKLVEHAIEPEKATIGSAGLDLVATDCYYDGEFDYYEYGTGLSIEIPKGHVGIVCSRSSISKTGFIMANGIGIIDSDYRGEICLRFRRISSGISYLVGDRIGQLVILPLTEYTLKNVSKLNETDRGSGGFGSTGR